jgi:broad specificity phosphatase PhoE
LDLAQTIAKVSLSKIVVDRAMGENDRSSTGFLPPDKFEATANRFFGNPTDSIDGWERAVDAQDRIVSAVSAAITPTPHNKTLVFCGHGAVGTLLKCFMGERAISRQEDQQHRGRHGGGNCFVFDFATRALISDWMPMEELEPGWALART